MQNRRRTQARVVAAQRPDWMPQPLVLATILALWTAATALHFLTHVWPY